MLGFCQVFNGISFRSYFQCVDWWCRTAHLFHHTSVSFRIPRMPVQLLGGFCIEAIDSRSRPCQESQYRFWALLNLRMKGRKRDSAKFMVQSFFWFKIWDIFINYPHRCTEFGTISSLVIAGKIWTSISNNMYHQIRRSMSLDSVSNSSTMLLTFVGKIGNIDRIW